MNINKQTMAEETRNFLKVLFDLPEVEKVSIKEVVIASLEDEESINRGLDLCYHDRFSDLDISILVRVNSLDFYRGKPLYSDFLPRLRFEDRFMGMNTSTRFNFGMHEEHLRICLKSGFRMDLLCWIRCDDTMPPFPQSDKRISIGQKDEKNLWEDWSLEKTEQFWFVALQALGKLMRKDYLIADHLSHTLLMEGLVIQMQLRDNLYHTQCHRYGYADDIDYLNIDLQLAQQFMSKSDAVYDRIAEQLYRAVVSYDRLVKKSNLVYESLLNTFIEIWRGYIA